MKNGSCHEMRRFIVIIVLSVSLMGCFKFSNNRFLRESVISYVNSNYELLEAFPYDDIKAINSQNNSFATSLQKKQAVIGNYFGNDTRIENVAVYNDNFARFYYTNFSERGLISAGFYFSREDIPYSLGLGIALTKIKPGIFEGENDVSKIYTEKIRDNWYYYELIHKY